jgi:exonuclease III
MTTTDGIIAMRARLALQSDIDDAAVSKIVMWNANGIRSRIRDGTLAEFLDKTHGAVLIGIVEAKANERMLNDNAEWRRLLGVHGITHWAAHFSRPTDRLKGLHGVLWLSRRPIHRLMSGRDHMGSWADEGRMVCVELPRIIAVLLYAPPDIGKHDKARRISFTEATGTFLKRVIKRAKRSKKAVLVCADVNAIEHAVDAGLGPHETYTGPGSLPWDTALFDLFRGQGLTDAYVRFHGPDYHVAGNHFTWEGKDTAFHARTGVPRRQRIDHFWTNMAAKDVLGCAVWADKYGSDHHPVTITTRTDRREPCIPASRPDARDLTALRDSVMFPEKSARHMRLSIKEAMERLEKEGQEQATSKRLREIHRTLLGAQVRTDSDAEFSCPRVTLMTADRDRRPRNINVLLDTGARVSLIHPDAVGRFFPNERVRECSLDVVVASGDRYTIQKNINATFIWNTAKLTVKMYIMRDLPVDALWGWGACRRHHIDILHNDTAVHTDEKGFRMTLPTARRTTRRILEPPTLLLTRDVTIPPGRQAFEIPVHIPKRLKKDHAYRGVVQGVTTGNVPCVISLRNGKGLLPMWNDSVSPRVLEKGTPLCVFVPQRGVVATKALQTIFQKRRSAHVLLAAMPGILSGRTVAERAAMIAALELILRELTDSGELDMSQ